MDRLESLAAFVAVADRGGFAAAARQLRVSPPAVTRAIGGLEARLGVQLFQRTTRSVRLTGEGAVFLVRCRQVLADLKDAEHAVMGAVAEPQGALTITASVVFGRLHITPILADLLAAHPRLSARLLLIDRPVNLVEEGIDVAVRIGDLPDSALHAIKVGEVRRVLVASPNFLAVHGVPTSVTDLRRYDTIAFTGISPGDEWRFGREGRQIVHVRPKLVVNTADAALAAAVLGVGVAHVLSYQAGAEIASGRLCTVLDEASTPPIPIHLVFQASRGASSSVRAFLDQATAYFRDTPV